MATPSPRKEWMCTACGKKEIRYVSAGRPQPGKCPRKKGDKPHSWTVNRKMQEYGVVSGNI